MSATETPSDHQSGESRGLSRRTLLRGSAASGVGIALTGGLAHLFGAEAAAAGPARVARQPGYGPLLPDPAGLLALPAGFRYTVVAQAGVTRLDSGELTPGNADGTASFQRRGGGTVLVNNHELSGTPPFPVPHLPDYVYDEQAPGGTTTIEVDAAGNRVREYVSLAGTLTNCAGGRTPWETWMSCEETEATLGKPHGYVFEVDPYDQDFNRDPTPLKCLGRYAHESLVVDPDTGTFYLTEDASGPNGLLYRWKAPHRALPLRRGSLRDLPEDAGKLQAVQAFAGRRGEFVPDLSVATEPGTTYRVRWIDVPDPTAATTSTRKQFGAGGVTRSRKLEGMWWGDGGAYFVASFARTSDGSAAQHDGQVWFIDPHDDTIELKLHFAYTPADQDADPDGPDNITVSAYGGLIIAEDGEGQQHLVGSTEAGEPFFFARNEKTDENSEFTGPTFSRDRKILFANVQTPGTVFAIQGPFKRLR